MKEPYRRWLIGSLLLVVMVITGYAGGPPIVTIEGVPEYFVVGQPETLKFVVRSFCCNHVPLENQYAVRVVADRLPEIRIPALRTGERGEYAATLTLPQVGEWTISIEMSSHVFTALLPIRAIPWGVQAPKPLSQVAKGERRFIEKGCISCHVNREVAAPRLQYFWRFEAPLTKGPPDLTERTFADDYLRRFLTNPSTARKGATMPQLALNADDIAALVAFINRDRSTAASETP